MYASYSIDIPSLSQYSDRVFPYAKPRHLGEASRDFVALFILNPAAAPLVPARCALASSYMLSRTLQPKNLTPENLQARDLNGISMGLEKKSSPHDPVAFAR